MSAAPQPVSYLLPCLFFVYATACEAEIRREDDDGAGASGMGAGAPSDGAGAPGGEGPVGGASSATFDVVAACTELCSAPCVGSASLCVEYCLEDIWGGCESESVDRYAACEMGYCFDDDCALVEEDLFRCVRRGNCQDEEELAEGASFPDEVCDGVYDDSCECVGTCLDGHTARVACEKGLDESGDILSTCLCFFDDVLVGECTREHHACWVEESCCGGWFAAD